MARAYYTNKVSDFLRDDNNAIIGGLTSAAGSSGFYQQLHTQTASWDIEINLLKEVLSTIGDASNWWILLEYPIPRRGKRVDVILLAHDIIFVLELKCGSDSYLKSDMEQVEDYALDIKDFHSLSHHSIIFPILVSTNAPAVDNNIDRPELMKALKCSKESLSPELLKLLEKYANKSSQINGQEWDNADYDPTPTIIEAAQSLYARQNVREILQHHAGIQNLTETTNAILDAINEAKEKHEKIICFVTGVPGAGKTLAGLNIVHNADLHKGKLGAFLSGNGPLVKILNEALARDHSKRTHTRIKESRREVSTFVLNVHHFIDAYYQQPEKIPADKIIVFDEAQRAWNLAQARRKFKREHSEPETLIEIMNRHTDWAVIVALIGGGQEINTGEAGLSEWGRVLLEKFPNWKVFISPKLAYGAGVNATDPLFTVKPEALQISEVDALHLDVSIRSFRAKRLTDFIEELLNLQPEHAKQIMQSDLQDYPLVMTRDLEVAKTWLRDKQRGTRRIGLVCSSGAKRLKPYGFNLNRDSGVEEWFLNPAEDVRSSFYLEDPATEFDIQGLEIDWAGLCWGGDFRMHKDGVTYKKFTGTKWHNVNDLTIRKFTKNKYRVLLTRAREGMVIFVPPGLSTDYTRPPEFYDCTADYLKACGIPEI